MFATFCLGTTTCGASGSEIEKQKLQRSNEVGPADILYESIVEEMNARSWEIATASQDDLLVAGQFRALGQQLRQRVVARVIRSPRGVALNVQFEYQRLNRAHGEESWAPAADEATMARSHADEAEFGNAVQSRFAAKR